MHRKALPIALVLWALAPAVAAQKLEITPFVGYRAGGQVRNVFTGDEFTISSDSSFR